MRLPAALLALALAALPAQSQQASQAGGAILRGLDKVSGEVVDFELSRGQVAKVWRLEVGLADCRYPAGNPAGDAYAWLDISDEQSGPVFAGWMVASSPALNALDHSRYDIWVLRCRIS